MTGNTAKNLQKVVFNLLCVGQTQASILSGMGSLLANGIQQWRASIANWGGGCDISYLVLRPTQPRVGHGLASSMDWIGLDWIGLGQRSYISNFFYSVFWK